jgi:hypothetical protein
MNIKFLINEYQNIEPDEGINITFEEWDEIPQNIVIKDIFTINTQRYRDFGLIDHIQIEMSESSSTLLGLWILGCYYQKKHSHYTIQLTHKNSDVKTIKMNIESDPTLNISLDSFNWFPERIDDFEQPTYTNIKPYMKLSSSTKEIYNSENYDQRDLLIGFGNLSAACILAEFFLNFGHNLSKDTNYEYLKEIYSSDFLNNNSCEVRVHKIDAPKFNVFDSEK